MSEQEHLHSPEPQRAPSAPDRNAHQVVTARAEATSIGDYAGALSCSAGVLGALDSALVQFRQSVASRVEPPVDPRHTAQRGVSAANQPLPFAADIQRAFGRFDISTARAQVGGAAAEACSDLGAMAYATGDRIGFARQPDLFTAAHEAAHVVQQRGGVSLRSGVGQSGDAHERHADEVAGLVVAGKSAESALARYDHGASTATGAVQLKPKSSAQEHRETATEARKVIPKVHMVFERLAHAMAYEDTLSDEQQHDLMAWGYRPEAGTVDGEHDFQMMRFDPDPERRDDPYVKQLHGGPVRPVLAFRGTFSLTDARVDFQPGGVGYSQWYLNEGAITNQLAAAAAQGSVVVTGHSLGGALAQICAAFYPGSVGSVVTFQSPAIPSDVVDMLRNHNAAAEPEGKVDSTHYQVNGDIVDEVGEEWTPGRVVHVDIVEDGFIDAHTDYISDSVTDKHGEAWVDGHPTLQRPDGTAAGAIEPVGVSATDDGSGRLESVDVKSTDAWKAQEKHDWMETGRKDVGKNDKASRKLKAQGELAAGAREFPTSYAGFEAMEKWLAQQDATHEEKQMVRDNAISAFKDLFLAETMLKTNKLGDDPMAAVDAAFEHSKGRRMNAAERKRTKGFLEGRGVKLASSEQEQEQEQEHEQDAAPEDAPDDAFDPDASPLADTQTDDASGGA